jgi:hypothetical protein
VPIQKLNPTKENTMDNIIQIKAALFDIIRRQAIFQQEIQKLENDKENKLKELVVAEQAVNAAEKPNT